MTAVMQKIQEDAKKKEDEKWERKREVQVKKIKENGIYDKVSRLQINLQVVCDENMTNTTFLFSTPKTWSRGP